MNKQEAIKEAGKRAIEEINNGNPDFTNRVMDNDMVEFVESAKYTDGDGDVYVIAGYWYFDKKEVDAVETIDMLNWTDAENYEVIG